VLSLARDTGTRIRLFDEDGKLITDSHALGLRNLVLRDPDKDPFNQTDRALPRRVIDTVAGADRAPLYRERGASAGSTGPMSAPRARRTAPPQRSGVRRTGRR
jgi:two-component system sensor histidine kinase ChvG